ncbi:unnamed protein product [Lepidochelys kempii]
MGRAVTENPLQKLLQLAASLGFSRPAPAGGWEQSSHFQPQLIPDQHSTFPGSRSHITRRAQPAWMALLLESLDQKGFKGAERRRSLRKPSSCLPLGWILLLIPSV